MNNFSQAPWKIMALALFLIFAGCDKADKPIRVGFIGGLSSRNLDVGESDRKSVV